MTVNVTGIVYDFYDEPLRIGDTFLTFRHLILYILSGVQEPKTAEALLYCYRLACKIAQNDNISFSDTEKAVILRAGEKVLNPLLFGRLYDFLYGEQ
jgi:hypothetical protein